MFRRSFWEKHPFTDGPKPGGTSEYDAMLRAAKANVKIASASSIVDGEPRLACRIHAGNSSSTYKSIFDPKVRQDAFTRTPEYDEMLSSKFSVLGSGRRVDQVASLPAPEGFETSAQRGDLQDTGKDTNS